jgi:hypothetical protein
VLIQDNWEASEPLDDAVAIDYVDLSGLPIDA